MLKKNNILFILSFIFSSTVYAECGSFDLRYLSNKKIIVKKEVACLYNEESASSKKCEFVVNSNCPFSKIKKTKNYDNFMSEDSSPGRNLCESVNGTYESYELKISGAWKPFERCVHKTSGEFVEIGSLIRHYKSL